jgi:hypothetical protein
MRRVLITTALIFALSATALAAELFTSPLITSGNNQFQCRILNVSKTALMVRVQLFDTQKSVIDDSGDVELAPLGDLSASGASVDNPFFCKFTVQGKKTNIRASASIVEAGTTIVSVPAE